MANTEMQGSEARVALYLVTFGIIGSIIMALVSNFAK
jgi:hypothetical protein